MKKMTCSQLGGAWELKFFANSLDEIAEKKCKQRGMKMFEMKDSGHMAAMEEMSKLMVDTAAIQDWMEKKCEELERLPNET